MTAKELEKMSDLEMTNAVYDIFDEDTRLSSKAGQVEYLTTMRYIHSILKPGCHVLDLGAGTGVYSFPLSEEGYHVEALELADRNVRIFRSRLSGENDPVLTQGNAMDLSAYADKSFDAVLLFGPLYHLRSEKDRSRVLSEAKRVLKDGGTLFVSFINNDMIPLSELSYNPDYFANGDYDHDTFKVRDFPFVFFTPSQCRQMLTEAGLCIRKEIASDGVSELLREKINAMDEENYRQYLKYHAYCCEKPEMIGHSNHLLYMTEKKQA